MVSIVVFRNSLHNTFALDDYYRVVDNPGIQQFWPPWRHFVEPRTMSTLDRITQYRPLLPLTLSVDYAIAGNSPVAHHVGNLLIQCLAALLAFALCLELLTHWSGLDSSPRRKLAISTLAALIFAIHPISGVAVNYISARDLLLMQVFFLSALLAYARMRRTAETPGRWTVVLLLLFLSLIAKTNLVIAPALFLSFDLLLARDSVRDRATWLRTALIASTVAGFFLLTRLVLGFSDLQQVVAEGSPVAYSLTQARLHLFHYLPHFWWPFSIRLLPGVEPGTIEDPRVWLGVAALCAALVLAWRARARTPLLAFCVLAYLILMIPESSIVPLHQPAADYRAYVGSIFVFLAMSAAVWHHLPGRVALTGFAVYVALVSIALNRNWKTAESLWTHSVIHGGDAIAHMNLALSIPNRSDPRVRHHLEEALRLNPAYVLAHSNLCLLQIDVGEADAGIGRCEYAVSLAPGWAQTHYWLASGYRRIGRMADAAAASAHAARTDPANIEYAYEAMLDAQRTGDWTASLEFADAVAKRSPDYKEVRFGRGFALQMLGRTQESLAEYQAVLRRDANHVQVNFNSGYALMSSGRCAEAIPYYQQTLRARPDYTEARLHLESCRQRARSMLNDASRTEVPSAGRAGTPAPQESATRQLPSSREQ